MTKTKLLCLAMSLFMAMVLCISSAQAQITITEINYNPPESGTDSLEYVELYNPSASSVDITGYKLIFGGSTRYTFSSYSLPAKGVVVVAVNGAAVMRQYGLSVLPFTWTSSGLSNTGTTVKVENASAGTEDEVTYASSWQTETNGNGKSLCYCPSATDNNVASSWFASRINIGKVINAKTLYGSPGVIECNTTWNGTTWSDGTPSISYGAIIASNTAPSSFTCKELFINSGFSLNSTGALVTINGDIINSGNGFTGTGTVSIASNSTLSGNAITFGGVLNLSSGTFNTGGLFKVAPGGSITGNYANISGNVTLQQNVVGQRGWRVFGNPFTSATTLATVASTNSLTINTTPQVSGLTDVRTFSNASNGWSNVTASTVAGNEPFALFIRGLSGEVTGSNYIGGPTDFTYNVSGTLNGNSVSITPSSSSNFMLVGNPFPAAVTTQSLTGGSSKPYYVYQIEQGSTTTQRRTRAGSWVPASGNSSNTATIPVLGALAYQPSSTASYNITTADINNFGTPATELFREQNNEMLELVVQQQGMYQDKLFVKQNMYSTTEGNDNNDLIKLANDNVNFYTITPGKQRLSIDTRKTFDSIVPLGISALAGDYAVKVASNSLIGNYKVYLKDYWLGNETLLEENTIIPFAVTADAASKGEARFALRFAKNAVIVPIASNFQIKVLGNSNSNIRLLVEGAENLVNIAVHNMEGKLVATKIAGNGIINIPLVAPVGMYLVIANDGKQSLVQKTIQF